MPETQEVPTVSDFEECVRQRDNEGAFKALFGILGDISKGGGGRHQPLVSDRDMTAFGHPPFRSNSNTTSLLQLQNF